MEKKHYCWKKIFPLMAPLMTHIPHLVLWFFVFFSKIHWNLLIFGPTPIRRIWTYKLSLVSVSLSPCASFSPKPRIGIF